MKTHVVVDVMTEDEAEYIAVQVFSLMQRGWKRVVANRFFDNEYSKQLEDWDKRNLNTAELTGNMWVKKNVKRKIDLPKLFEHDDFSTVETVLFTREEALAYEEKKDLEPNDLL